MKFGCCFPFLRRHNRSAERQSAWPEIAMFDEEKKEFLKLYTSYQTVMLDLSGNRSKTPPSLKLQQEATDVIREGHQRAMSFSDMRRCRLTLSDILKEIESEQERYLPASSV